MFLLKIKYLIIYSKNKYFKLSKTLIITIKNSNHKLVSRSRDKTWPQVFDLTTCLQNRSDCFLNVAVKGISNIFQAAIRLSSFYKLVEDSLFLMYDRNIVLRLLITSGKYFDKKFQIRKFKIFCFNWPLV